MRILIGRIVPIFRHRFKHLNRSMQTVFGTDPSRTARFYRYNHN